METKPYNQLQPGDTVTGVRSEQDPSVNVDFDEAWTIRKVSEYNGFTVAMFMDRGRFWTTRGKADDRVAILAG